MFLSRDGKCEDVGEGVKIGFYREINWLYRVRVNVLNNHGEKTFFFGDFSLDWKYKIY